MAADETVRVFISSTFRDMHAERDHLVTTVFPELRERCRRLGLQIFDVDLRWGVPEKGPDGEHANSWEYCRQWIDRVQPFFICLLGQRYGTVPPPEDMRDERERAAYAGMSITEMEIVHGALSGRLARQTYFYFRDALVPQDAGPEILTTFVQDEARVANLKSLIRSSGKPCRDYPCRWTGSSFADLEDFGAMVLEDLWSGILRDKRYTPESAWAQILGEDFRSDARYTDHARPLPADLAEASARAARPEPPSPLENERLQMEAFEANRLRWFQGRTREIDELRAWIDSDNQSDPQIAVLAAERGQGKSALMARLHRVLAKPGTVVIAHFVGATELSAGARNLVERLMNELDAADVAWERAPGTKDGTVEEERDYPALCRRLAARLAEHGYPTPIVLLIDAVNQLTDGHDLAWLPRDLPPQVKIVLSCVREPDLTADEPASIVLRALDELGPAVKWFHLGSLGDGDVCAIVAEYLLEYCKELDVEHIDAICRTPQAHQPLYLLVLLSELRALGGNDMNRVVPDLLRRLTREYPDTVSLFGWVLRSLERAYGAGPLGRWCGYLAVSRRGMASQELADLLEKHLGPGARATALRIERGLRPYLQARGPQLDFFHEQLRAAVAHRYPVAKPAEPHTEIADYLDGRWREPNVHAVSELPWHRRNAGQLGQLAALLSDLHFIEGKCQAELYYDLLEDYRADFLSLPAEEGESVAAFAQFTGQHGALFARLPRLVLQQAVNEPEGSVVEQAAIAAVMDTGRQVLRRRFGPDEERRTILGIQAHHSSIESCAVSPDGSRIVSWSYDKTIKVWDASTGRQVFEIATAADPGPCTFTPDGQFIITAGADRTVRQWSAVTGQQVRSLQQPRSERHCLAVSPDGAWMVTGGMSRYDDAAQKWVRADNLSLIDRATGATAALFDDVEESVQDCTFSGNGERLAVATYNEEVVVWDFGKSLVTPEGWRRWFQRHKPSARILGRVEWKYNHPTCCALSADGTLLAVGCQGGAHRYGAVSVWRLPGSGGGEPQQLWKSPSWEWVTACAFSPDGRLVLASSEDGTLKVWEAESGLERATLEGHAKSVTDCCFTSDGKHVVSASNDGTLRKWALPREQGRKRAPDTILKHRACINALTFSGTGERLLVGSGKQAFSGPQMDLCNGELAVWDAHAWKRLMLPMAHDGIWITGCAFLHRETEIAGCFNNQVELFDSQGQKICELDVAAPFLATTVAAYGDILAIGGPLGGEDCPPLRFFDGRENREIGSLPGHTGDIASCSFSGDGRWFASASADETVRIWDVVTLTCVHVLACGSPATSCAFSPDSTRLIATSADHKVTIWDVQRGERLCTIEDRTGFLRFPLHGCCFSPDGTLVTACLGARNVRIWDATSGAEVAAYWTEFLIRCIAWQPQTAMLVAGDERGQLHVLELLNGFSEGARSRRGSSLRTSAGA